MKFLIVGLGSMGKRRIRNLQQLKAGEIIGVDLSEERRKEASKKYGIKTVNSVEEGLALNPDAVVVSTPPNYHMAICKQVAEAGKHFFVEASVLIEPGFKEVIVLAAKKGIVAAPSCTMRFHELIRKIKGIVDEKRYGKPLAVFYHMGQYLPDWHPWEDISKFYVGKKETGAAREMFCFELEWINWIFGDISRLSCIKGKYSDLKVDIDDTYSVTLEYKQGLVANILIDVVARHAYRQFKVLFEEGVLEWDWLAEKIRLYDAKTKEWTEIAEGEGFKEEGYLAKENMYIDEMAAFVAAVKGEKPWEYTLAEDLATLQLLLKAEESSDKGKHITVEDE